MLLFCKETHQTVATCKQKKIQSISEKKLPSISGNGKLQHTSQFSKKICDCHTKHDQHYKKNITQVLVHKTFQSHNIAKQPEMFQKK